MRPCVVDRCIIGVIVQWNRHDLSKIRVIIARTLWRFNPQRFNRKNLFYKSRGIKRKIVRASSKYRSDNDESEGRGRGEREKRAHSFDILGRCVHARFHLVVSLLALQEASTSLSNHSLRWSVQRIHQDRCFYSTEPHPLSSVSISNFAGVSLNNFLKKLDDNRVAARTANFCSKILKLNSPIMQI